MNIEKEPRQSGSVDYELSKNKLKKSIFHFFHSLRRQTL